MPKKKGKITSPVQDEVPSDSIQKADADEDSEPEFENIEKTLEQSLSHESLTWMRHVIRVQARDVVKSILKQEKESKAAHEKNISNEMAIQLDELRKKLHDIQQEVETLRTENAKQRRQIERLEHVNFEKQSSINKMKTALDEIAQQKQALSMQIVGFAENKDECDDIKKLTKVLKEKAGVKVKPTDIIEMRRLGRRNDAKKRNIIVRFKDKDTRQKIYKERSKFITPGSPTKSIYFNDALTQHRQQLLYAARQLVKSKKLYVAWSQDGNILVRKGENTKIVQVHDYDDLRIIKAESEETESEENRDETASELTHLSGYTDYWDSDV